MLFLYFASENRDFTGSMWRVDFPAGVAEAEFTIPIVQDTSSEEPEHFYLDLVIETPVDERVSAVDPSRQTVIIIITGVLVYTVHDNYYDTVIQYTFSAISKYASSSPAVSELVQCEILLSVMHVLHTMQAWSALMYIFAS